jgi:hypothetical protein
MICSAQFIATTATPFVPNNISGCWIESGSTLVAFKKFDTPVPIASVGDFLEIDLPFPLDFDQSITA